MMNKAITVIFWAAMLSAVSAAPRISVDNETFSGGPVAENSRVEAVFRLTNTGTQPLRITNVRPDCGCTIAAYDTLIAPGGTSIFKPVVDIRGMRPGLMRRGITVTSNAANTPTLRLMIEAAIIPIVGVSPNHLTLTGTETGAVNLTSAKKDLNVNSVIFRPHESGNTPSWAANVPLNLNYRFNASDSTNADGQRVYSLVITPPGTKGEPMTGVFVINTNHPDRREITISGKMQ